MNYTKTVLKPQLTRLRKELAATEAAFDELKNKDTEYARHLVIVSSAYQEAIHSMENAVIFGATL